MIKQSSFSQEWINTVSEKYQYHDRNLIEKVIRAYSLLEMLVKNGCPAIWKGGSSLMLILGDSASRLSVVRDVFNRIVPIELGYREQAPDVAPVYEDIRQTALCISTRGAEGIGQFDLLQDGIKRMQAFMLRRRYMIEDATVDAAKAALLATMLENGVDSFTPYSSDLEGLAELRLADTVPVRLSRLRRNNPEAYYYWVKVSELLKRS